MVLKCFPHAFHYFTIWIQHHKYIPGSTSAQTCHPPLEPGAAVKGKGCPVLCTEVKPSRPASPPFPPQPKGSFLFGSAVLFLPASVTILWLMSNSQRSCSSLLLPPLLPVRLLASYQGPCLWISALYCFLHSEVPSIFAAFVFSLLLLHVVLCCPLFSRHCALSCAKWLLFPLWEMSLKNTLPLHQRVK